MSYVGILYSHHHVYSPQIQAWVGDPNHPRNHVDTKDRSLLFLGANFFFMFQVLRMDGRSMKVWV